MAQRVRVYFVVVVVRLVRSFSVLAGGLHRVVLKPLDYFLLVDCIHTVVQRRKRNICMGTNCASVTDNQLIAAIHVTQKRNAKVLRKAST